MYAVNQQQRCRPGKAGSRLQTSCQRHRRSVQPICSSIPWWGGSIGSRVQRATSLYLCTAAAAAAVFAGSVGVPPADASDIALRNIKGRTNEQVEAIRAEGHFQRAFDGHIRVQKSNGEFLDVRLDPENDGVVLLRDKSGMVYFLAYEFKQIDLSDDEMVRDMFSDHSWEEDLDKLDYIDENGAKIKSISQEDFYEWWRWGAGGEGQDAPTRVAKD